MRIRLLSRALAVFLLVNRSTAQLAVPRTRCPSGTSQTPAPAQKALHAAFASRGSEGLLLAAMWNMACRTEEPSHQSPVAVDRATMGSEGPVEATLGVAEVESKLARNPRRIHAGVQSEGAETAYSGGRRRPPATADGDAPETPRHPPARQPQPAAARKASNQAGKSKGSRTSGEALLRLEQQRPPESAHGGPAVSGNAVRLSAAQKTALQRKHEAWYAKHFAKLDKQPGRFLSSSELHAKIRGLQHASSGKRQNGSLPGAGVVPSSSAVGKAEHAQWREKDRWWGAVLANEDLRAECDSIREARAHGGRAVRGGESARLQEDLRARWSKLDCGRRDNHASSLAVDET